MSQSAPTFNQIRAKVLAVRRKVPDARCFGIRSAGRYTGERLRHDGAEMYRLGRGPRSDAGMVGIDTHDWRAARRQPAGGPTSVPAG